MAEVSVAVLVFWPVIGILTYTQRVTARCGPFLLQVVLELHPAAKVLKVIWDEYRKVQVNKVKLGHLLERCKRVIGAVDQELDKRATRNVEDAIQQLLRCAQPLQISKGL